MCYTLAEMIYIFHTFLERARSGEQGAKSRGQRAKRRGQGAKGKGQRAEGKRGSLRILANVL
jgi:hypothetical protein